MTDLQDRTLPTARARLDEAMTAAQHRRFTDAVALLREAVKIDPALADGPLGNAVSLLGRGVDLENLKTLAPLRLNTLVSSGWIQSLLGGRPVNSAGEPIPWFTYPAIDFLEPKIQWNWNVLEWGCGNSTLWWAARTRQVLSVEHDAEWHRTVAAEAPTNARVVLAEDRERYVSLDRLCEVATAFDVVVIDGEERNACARRALSAVRPDGLIVFDNSDRKSVREGLGLLSDAGWKRIDFFGLLPSYCYRTCTSIFYRDDALLRAGPLPCDSDCSLGPTCAQVLGE